MFQRKPVRNRLPVKILANIRQTIFAWTAFSPGFFARLPTVFRWRNLARPDYLFASVHRQRKRLLFLTFPPFFTSEKWRFFTSEFQGGGASDFRGLFTSELFRFFAGDFRHWFGFVVFRWLRLNFRHRLGAQRWLCGFPTSLLASNSCGNGFSG